jgi:hypothetical protein
LIRTRYGKLSYWPCSLESWNYITSGWKKENIKVYFHSERRIFSIQTRFCFFAVSLNMSPMRYLCWFCSFILKEQTCFFYLQVCGSHSIAPSNVRISCLLIIFQGLDLSLWWPECLSQTIIITMTSLPTDFNIHDYLWLPTSLGLSECGHTPSLNLRECWASTQTNLICSNKR